MTAQEALQELWDNVLHPTLKPEISEETKAIAIEAIENTLRSTCSICNDPKTVTNADRIRAMSDEELAKGMCRRSIDTICDIVCGGDCKAIKTLSRTSKEVCRDIILAWLHRLAEEEK